MILRDPRRPLLFTAVLSWICLAPACGSTSDEPPPVNGPSANGGVAPMGGQPATPTGGSVSSMNGGAGGLPSAPTGGAADWSSGGAAPATTGGAAPSRSGRFRRERRERWQREPVETRTEPGRRRRVFDAEPVVQGRAQRLAQHDRRGRRDPPTRSTAACPSPRPRCTRVLR